MFQSLTVRDWEVKSVLMVSLGVGRTLLSRRDARQPSLYDLMTSQAKQETGEGKKGSVPMALDKACTQWIYKELKIYKSESRAFHAKDGMLSR